MRKKLSHYAARKLAKHFDVRMPKVGWEVCLRPGVWLSSTGHAQFGWVGADPMPATPWEVRCRCADCPPDCPTRP